MFDGSECETTELAARLALQDPRVKTDAYPAAAGLAAAGSAWRSKPTGGYDGFRARSERWPPAPTRLLLGGGQAIQPLVEQLSLACRERAGRLG